MMSKSDWDELRLADGRVASLRKSGFGVARRSAREGAREGWSMGGPQLLMRPAKKAVKDQHHAEEANGRLAAES
jgi:hypothetical protein